MLLKRLLCGVLAALWLSSACLAQQTHSVIPTDYALDDMSEEDRDELAKMIDTLARLEVIMTTCVGAQNYDVRLRAEIESCIVPESIQRVQTFFDRQVDAYSQNAHKVDCQEPQLQSDLPKLEKEMDSALWKLGLMCDLCILC